MTNLPPDENFRQKTGVRDVPDFFHRWDEFRQTIVPALDEDVVLDQEQREILYWLIQLADRVGEDDIR